MRKLLPALALLFAIPAGAATYYVKAGTGSDANPGTSLAPFATLQKCIATMARADTCSVDSGTYVGDASTAFNLCSDAANSYRDLSGTGAGAYTKFIGTGATKPKLCHNSSCTDNGNYNPNVILGEYDRARDHYAGHACQYIQFEGFEVHGNVTIEEGGPTHHITITGNDFNGAGENDGNTNLMWLQDAARGGGNVHDIQIDHNIFHNILHVDGFGNQHSLIKNFGATHLTIEFNNFDTNGCGSGGSACCTDGGTNCTATSVAAFDDKDCPYSNVLRYNYFRGGTNTSYIIRIANQCGALTAPTACSIGGVGVPCEGSGEVYGNVAELDGIQMAAAENDGAYTTPVPPTHYDGPWSFHHNTLINGSNGDAALRGGISSPQAFRNITWKNNIVTGTAGLNIRIEAVTWGAMAGGSFDYNAYADRDFVGGGFSSPSASTIAGWRTMIQAAGCTGCEANSSDTVACTFVAGTDTPYHVQAATTCKTFGEGGTEVGAYGVTSCVGYTCGAAAPTTVPIVTGVRLSNVKVTP